MPRPAAVLIALIAWAGLIIQFTATFAGAGSLGETLWILTRFFTVLTNLVVAVTFTAIALGRRVSNFLMGGVTLAIVLVGLVYALLLRGLVHLSGGAVLADLLLHKIVPLLVPLYWLFLAPKGDLRWRDPWLWTLYPLLYFAYALARGLAGDKYPYPFMDVTMIGWPHTAINAAAIAAAFVIAGHALVWLDRRRVVKAPQ
jgi:hypothetical protein